MKFGFKHYFEPTPRTVRMLGDSLAAAGTFGASIVILNGNPKVGTIIMIIAVVGKFISNFFAEEETKDGNVSTGA